MVYVGAGCGLRGGEVLGLEPQHIDFLRRELHVVQQLVVHGGRKPFIGPLKTKTSRRVVELPQVTANALARHLELFPPRPVEIEDDTDPKLNGPRTAQLVFTNAIGRPVYRATGRTPGHRPREGSGCPSVPASMRCGTTSPLC